VYAPVGTPTVSMPVQDPGDCQEVQCDGSGGTVVVTKTTDVPVDGNNCTDDICTGNAPSNPILVGTMCGGTVQQPQLCTAQGQCGCQTNADCTSPNTCGGGNPGTPLVCGCTKTSCAAEGKTCGVISDECFSTLNCDNGVKNPAETDVDCGGPTSGCATRCSQGKKCSVTNDCVAGLTCVDGVCCNTPCNTSLCQACSLAKKGSGQDGVCGNIVVGTDPDNECAVQSASTCGTTGACNGSGACSLHPSGTTCNGAVCVGNTLHFTDTCNGSGMCIDNGSQACGNYVCKVGAACPTTCTGDADCTSGNYCNVSNQCVTKLPDGSACGGNNQCQNNACVDGVCCNGSCGGLCQACSASKKGSGANGVCGPVMSGTDPDNECATQAANTCGTTGVCNGAGACQLYSSATQCASQTCSNGVQTSARTCDGAGTCSSGSTMPCGTYACNAGGTACLTSCNGPSDCAAGNFCNNMNQCVGKKPDGQPCGGDGECTNDHCVDGVCCNTTCTGLCQSCLAANKTSGADGVCGPSMAGSDPDNECMATAQSTCGTNGFCNGAGACELWSSATLCMAATCSNGMQTTARNCDGAGMCAAGSTSSCAPYVCDAGGTACLMGCAANGDNDCSMGNYCNGSDQCVPKIAQGQPCSGTGATSQCATGFCVDGVCCDDLCDGICKACTATKKGSGVNGVCGNIAVNTDPDTECQGSKNCDGNGACEP
jgi:hypothetical protein